MGLTHVAKASDNILSKILTQDCPEDLVFCLSCNLKLKGFTEFMQKLKDNPTITKEVLDSPLTLSKVDTVVCDSSTINEELLIKQCDTTDQDPLTQNAERESPS